MTTLEHRAATAETPEVMPRVRDYLKSDTRVVPEVLLEESQRSDLGTLPVSKDAYLSKDYLKLEFERLWPKVWQMACRTREIPNPGDYYDYVIGDQSVLVVRGEDGEIRAHRNTCLHRGTKLAAGVGNAKSLRCRFHGWTWNLDGSLKKIPCRWEFPSITDEEATLPSVRVGVWEGFVFINFDPSAEPLEEFIGPDLIRHFAAWPMADRVKIGHVAKRVNSNWKNALDAFIESYHVMATHPQVLEFVGDCNAKQDLYNPHSRMYNAMGTPSPHLDYPVDAATIIEAQLGERLSDGLHAGDSGSTLPAAEEGQSAREVIADWVRGEMTARNGVDYSARSDAEILDAIQYFVFPNFCPWLGNAFPMVYRCRPDLHDPDWSLFEVMVLGEPVPGDTRPDREMRLLGPDEPWSAADDHLGGLGKILDQDVPNMEHQTAGMKNSSLTHVHYAGYQESSVRQFHENVARYVGR